MGFEPIKYADQSTYFNNLLKLSADSFENELTEISNIPINKESSEIVAKLFKAVLEHPSSTSNPRLQITTVILLSKCAEGFKNNSLTDKAKEVFSTIISANYEKLEGLLDSETLAKIFKKIIIPFIDKKRSAKERPLKEVLRKNKPYTAPTPSFSISGSSSSSSSPKITAKEEPRKRLREEDEDIQSSKKHKGEPSKKFVLPELSISDRGGSGDFSLYSNFFKANSQEYHTNGLSWSDKKMGDFFLQGLCRHYVCVKIGYLPDYDYEKQGMRPINVFRERPYMFILKNRALRPKSKPPLTGDQCISSAKIVGTLLQNLLTDKTFISLGVLFQRKKLEFEKVEGSKNPSGDDLIRLGQDQEILQQMILYWVQSFEGQMENFIEKKEKDSTDLSGVDLSQFAPQSPISEFLTNPDYEKLLQQL